MLRTNLIRSDLRPVFSTLSSGAMVWTNTKEASPTKLLVPTPTLVFGVRKTGMAAFTGSMPASRPIQTPSEAVPGETASIAKPKGPAGAEKTPSASVDDKAEFTDEGGLPAATEPARYLPAETPAIEPLLAPEAEVPSQSKTETPKIYLSIDSLPHLQLIEAIPVTVVELGDKLFTATVDALTLSATGDTLSDALVTVKEEIEVLHERLSKSRELDDDEKRYLQYLQSHIKSSEQSRGHKRGLWR